jgi:hypothetical protein
MAVYWRFTKLEIWRAAVVADATILLRRAIRGNLDPGGDREPKRSKV